MTVIMADQGLFVNCGKKPETLINHFQSLTEAYTNTGDCYIGRYSYIESHVIEEISNLVSIMRSKWFLVQDVILENNSISIKDILSARQFLNQSFRSIIKCLMVCDDNNRKQRFNKDILNYLQIFSTTIVSVSMLDEKTVLKLISACNVNDSFYQYCHTFLDIQYFKIVLYCLCDLGSEHFNQKLTLLLKDLIKLCNVNLKNANDKQPLKSVFSCSCVKYFWLTLQLILETKFGNSTVFWKAFNAVLSSDNSQFSLTLLREVAFLQCYSKSFTEEGTRSIRISPNFEFLEIKIKEILQESNSEKLLQSLKTIEPLLTNLWLREESLEIYSTIWTFYSKRLNVSNKNRISISSYELNETLDTILWSPKDCNEDFEMFVSLLIAHLREFPLHFNKIKGKIFTHTQGANKIRSLTEIGIIHVVVLYMALGSLNHEAIESKLINCLKEVVDDKYMGLVWNLYSGLMIKYVRDGRSIEKITPHFTEKLQKAASDQRSFFLIKNFILNFENIVENSSSMHLHQWQLIEEWLPKYQAVCYYGDLVKSLEVILLLLEKCSSPDSWEFWEAKFHYFIYPSLKHLASCSNPPGIIGKIAGRLSCISLTLTSDAFKYFNTETIPPSLSLEFLEVVLENYPEKVIFTTDQETLIVQSWIKICILTLDSQHDFSQKVIKLDIFPENLKNHLTQSRNSILSFIEYLGNDPKQCLRNQNLMKLVNAAFSNLDKILQPYIEKPQNEDITLKIYDYVSRIFLKCGSLLYSPNRPNTPVDRLLKTLILPDDFVTGRKAPHNFVLRALKITWPIFFEALVKLNVSTPLESMIVKYVSHFTSVDCPIIKCLENEDLAPIILQKLNKLYFGKPPYKESEPNTVKIIKILSDFIQSNTSLNLFKLLLKNSLLNIFMAIIYHPQRSAALQLVKIVSSSHFCKECKSEIQDAIFKITDSTMGFEYINYFQLMINLSRFLPENVKDCLDYVRKKIVDVERKRGIGFDKSLRTQLERLEQAINNPR